MDHPIAPPLDQRYGFIPIQPTDGRSAGYSPSILHRMRRLTIRERHGGTQSTQGQPSGQQPSYSPQGISTAPSQSRKRGIKRHLSGGDSPGDGGRGGRRRKGKEKDPDKGQPNRLWACPYVKRDPGSHLRCLRFELRRIVDVRQHLRRYHLQPLHCPTCHLIFPQDASRRDHIRQRACQQSNFDVPAGVTTDQWNSIAARGDNPGNGNNNQERRWFRIWEILFPGVDYPDSPYYAGSEFAERVTYTSQELQNGGYIQQVIDRFPPTQHADIREAIELVFEAFRDRAQEQDDTLASAASPLAVPSQIQSASPLPISQYAEFQEPSQFPRAQETSHLPDYSLFDPHSAIFNDVIGLQEVETAPWMTGFEPNNMTYNEQLEHGYYPGYAQEQDNDHGHDHQESNDHDNADYAYEYDHDFEH